MSLALWWVNSSEVIYVFLGYFLLFNSLIEYLVLFLPQKSKMTFDEAVSMMDRIKDIAIGAPIKGNSIQSLFIGPTDWELMTVFMTTRAQKGEDAAISELLGTSFSVYGVSVTYIDCGIPRWEMTILDNFEKVMNN